VLLIQVGVRPGSEALVEQRQQEKRSWLLSGWKYPPLKAPDSEARRQPFLVGYRRLVHHRPPPRQNPLASTLYTPGRRTRAEHLQNAQVASESDQTSIAVVTHIRPSRTTNPRLLASHRPSPSPRQNRPKPCPKVLTARIVLCFPQLHYTIPSSLTRAQSTYLEFLESAKNPRRPFHLLEGLSLHSRGRSSSPFSIPFASLVRLWACERFPPLTRQNLVELIAGEERLFPQNN
jgi:hypothetical protein